MLKLLEDQAQLLLQGHDIAAHGVQVGVRARRLGELPQREVAGARGLRVGLRSRRGRLPLQLIVLSFQLILERSHLLRSRTVVPRRKLLRASPHLTVVLQTCPHVLVPCQDAGDVQGVQRTELTVGARCDLHVVHIVDLQELHLAKECAGAVLVNHTLHALDDAITSLDSPMRCRILRSVRAARKVEDLEHASKAHDPCHPQRTHSAPLRLRLLAGVDESQHVVDRQHRHHVGPEPAAEV